MKMFQIKRLEDIAEIESIQQIEKEVWNMSPIPIHQTYTASHNGGLVLGAFHDNQLIGFQYSFPGYMDGRSYLCSHMLGILPTYQKSGLGKKMKEAQKEYALEMGYSLIVWTFDPLESINAYLNLHKLKGIGAAYIENHYGKMTDSLNKGLPTDRFLVEWWIRSDHVCKAPRREYIQGYKPVPVVETKLDKSGFPTISRENEINLKQDIFVVPIPENFQQIKNQQPELAKEWRYKTRKWFQILCENDFAASDVIRIPEGRVSHYIFEKRENLSV